jgi:prophage regulatory protein
MGQRALSQTHQPTDRLIRLNELGAMLGVSPSTIWRWERNGQMPLRFKIGARAVGWRLSEINDWIAERAASHGEKS